MTAHQRAIALDRICHCLATNPPKTPVAAQRVLRRLTRLYEEEIAEAEKIMEAWRRARP